jgi:pilus assembly protein CpaB
VQVVNLLVTPDQAETLSLASNSLKIQLVLRNPLDTQIAKVPPDGDDQHLYGRLRRSGSGAAAASGGEHKPAPKTYSITVSNGSKTTEEKFATPGGQH